MFESPQEALKRANEIFLDKDAFKSDELIHFYYVCKIMYDDEELKNARILGAKIDSWLDSINERSRYIINAFEAFSRGKKSEMKWTLNELCMTEKDLNLEIAMLRTKFVKYITSKLIFENYKVWLERRAEGLKAGYENVLHKINVLESIDPGEAEEFELYSILKRWHVSKKIIQVLKEMNVRGFGEFFSVTDKELMSYKGVGAKKLEQFRCARNVIQKTVFK